MEPGLSVIEFKGTAATRELEMGCRRGEQNGYLVDTLVNERT